MNPLLAPTAENAFIFSLLQFILTGLLFSVTLWFLWRNPRSRSDPRFRTLPTALAFLCAGFSIDCLEGLRSFYFHEPLRHSGLILTGSLVEPVAFLLLASSFLQTPLGRRLAYLLGGLVAILSTSLLVSDPLRWATGACQMFSLGILFTGTFVFLRRGFRREPIRTLTFAFLAIATTLNFLETVFFFSFHVPSSPLWGFRSFFTLGALVLLAIVLEKMSGNLPVQFFLRLNLLFIFLAGLLMIVITESTRHQHLDFAERELQHLAEYLRGHAIHFSNLGFPDEEILAKEEITRRIVSDFGKVPDIRSISIQLARNRIDFRIDEQGIITRRLFPMVDPGTGAPRPSHRIIGNLLRMNLPIMDAERVLGSVEIEKSLKAMNEKIAHALMVIFSSFTLTVILSAGLIGLIVYRAETTMQNQYRRIAETQRQLMQAAKLASIGELAGGVAHEINNPVGIILARSDYLKALSEQRRSSPDQIEDIEAIQRQARRVSRIVSDLLTFSRRHPLEQTPLRLNEVVQRSLDFAGSRIQEGRIHLQTNLREGLPRILGDRNRLEQVFLNILNNAVDALPGGGTILVETGTRTNSDGEKVFARFEDTGTGIPQENLKKIFDPFYSTKEEGKGTGLGLSISYGIVRDHKGNIDVESEPRRGTTFTITLPAGTLHP